MRIKAPLNSIIDSSPWIVLTRLIFIKNGSNGSGNRAGEKDPRFPLRRLLYTYLMNGGQAHLSPGPPPVSGKALGPAGRAMPSDSRAGSPRENPCPPGNPGGGKRGGASSFPVEKNEPPHQSDEAAQRACMDRIGYTKPRNFSRRSLGLSAKVIAFSSDMTPFSTSSFRWRSKVCIPSCFPVSIICFNRPRSPFWMTS